MHFKTTLMALLCAFFVTACGTNKHIDRPATDFDHISCTIGEPCKIIYGINGEEGFIEYQVEERGNNTYHVSGSVDIDLKVVGGMHPRVMFYVVFMDEDKIIAERKVHTGTKRATFDFEIELETSTKATQTSIADPVFKTWS